MSLPENPEKYQSILARCKHSVYIGSGHGGRSSNCDGCSFEIAQEKNNKSAAKVAAVSAATVNSIED